MFESFRFARLAFRLKHAWLLGAVVLNAIDHRRRMWRIEVGAATSRLRLQCDAAEAKRGGNPAGA